MIRITPHLLLFLAVVMPAAQRAAAPRPGFDPGRLDAAVLHVEEEVASGRIGAAALLVARNGAVAVEKGFGRMSRVPDAPPCRSDSVFAITSITKPIVATAVMKLVEQGRLKLEDPVQKHLPEFRGGDRGRMVVRHLLAHTSGLPDMLPENIELRKRLAPLTDFVAGAMRTPLLFEPGTCISYQSVGIMLAAEIVRRVSGQPFDAFLRQHVFVPLRMDRTSLGLGGLSVADTVLIDFPTKGPFRQSAGDGDWGWNSRYWRDFGAPWGGVHSTVGDIHRLMQAMLEDGKGVLSPRLVRAMQANQTPGLEVPWGLGWRIAADFFYDGSPAGLFGHNGGSGTLCWADPKRKIVFVLFTSRPWVEDDGKFHRTIGRMVSDAAN